MSRHYLLTTCSLLAVLSGVAAAPGCPTINSSCRYLPNDPQWPSTEQWQQLNDSVGGRLIRGISLASPCHGEEYNNITCGTLQERWASPPTYCSPFMSRDSPCSLGNIAPYAINVSSAQDVVAGLAFAQRNNIRLSVKNTGHDFLGRSTGAGSLALWMHNLNGMQVVNHTGPVYSGPALRLGAGVQGFEVYEFAARYGLRVTGPFNPTVGVVGGYVQGGGHGALQGAYGLAADNVLEYEVITTGGRHLVVSPSEYEDLFWALSGGGGGTYAVVLSATIKAYQDGVVAGASLSFSAGGNEADTDADAEMEAYWTAISAWHTQLLVHDKTPKLTTLFSFTNTSFSLVAATLLDSPASALSAVLAPFVQTLDDLGLNYTYETNTQSSFYDHFALYTPALPYGITVTNSTVGGRLIPRQTVAEKLPELVSALRNITSHPNIRINGIAANITHTRVRNIRASNAVLPAWRDALYTLNMDAYFEPGASTDIILRRQALTNANQDLLKQVTRDAGGGAYTNEATFDNPDWKTDYFGTNYDTLLQVKEKYDPGHALYGAATVGSDYWSMQGDGRLCVAAGVFGTP
ncbi:hypothetical protein AN7153.2 [Aspergillus nidulans FGSC A4]|uniref:FAD-binding PCMH-type domain-containing protein n=1 Tax=Emericella nidulans (strain FGSC A4 / ATCC 38163 / CBS 112.46 / NRRL 194 / M139) TaxID=227321 RepID=Q5AX27_EMENI|nr:hypothetical protein [Aspergillus nidulans FGSC A4]EAA61405.1 hypothetical protein AN7153.2 [Aspergillus nidulans FGSC A4]CBF78970.1 TPA: conserved hypothetical protein [Aspergillus nidulans FGSC A4]|eukprot:XP_664757.1 hypothetical protein AN7153.2 [Aspergillus nidulans FGSC A4]